MLDGFDLSLQCNCAQDKAFQMHLSHQDQNLGFDLSVKGLG